MPYAERTLHWFIEYRSTLKCERCPENHPGVLDFHHVNPSQKTVNIGNAVQKKWSKKRVLEEISKCIVLCSNCHRKLHYDERPPRKAPPPEKKRVQALPKEVRAGGVKVWPTAGSLV